MPLSAEQLAFLQSVDSPTIANAVEPFKLRDRTEGFLGGTIRCLFPELGTMVGHAVTATVASRPGPVASMAGFWRMFEAIAAAPNPVVVVLQEVDGAPTRCAYFGEVMATLAQRLGAVGVVCDSGVRDLAEVRALGLHYFAPYPVVSHGNFEILDVGVPVTLDGQPVHPGDVVHGDANGLVLVPEPILDELPAAVARIRERERTFLDFIASPEFSLAEYRRRAGY